jgi:hypothetical protein
MQKIVENQKNKDHQNNPQFTSWKQIKNENERIAREKLGLTEKTDIKDHSKGPTLKYVYDPEHKVKEDLKEKSRKENFELSKKILSKKHMDEVERLNFREDEIFDMGYYDGERKTFNKMKEERRKENVDYNMKIFSRQTIGVHGHELPKFSDSEQYREYWKFKDDWVENPKYRSQVQLLEDHKFYKKQEDLKVKDHTDDVPSEDDFKKVHILQEKKNDIILKVNGLNHYKNFDPNNPEPIDLDNIKRNHIYRWTTLVNQFSNNKFKKGRYFDNLPIFPDTINDDKAMFSSFADDGVFNSEFGNR